MPGLDHKGPMGQGAMTGRKMGRCTNYGASLKKNALPENEQADRENTEGSPDREGSGEDLGFGRGRGLGLGRGRGIGCGRGGRGGSGGRGRGMGRLG